MFPFDNALSADEIQDIVRHEKEKIIDVTGGKVSDMNLINEICMDLYAQVEREFGCRFSCIERNDLAEVHEFIDSYELPLCLRRRIKELEQVQC